MSAKEVLGRQWQETIAKAVIAKNLIRGDVASNLKDDPNKALRWLGRKS